MDDEHHGLREKLSSEVQLIQATQYWSEVLKGTCSDFHMLLLCNIEAHYPNSLILIEMGSVVLWFQTKCKNL